MYEDADNAVVTFDSTHQAMAAEDALRDEGVRLEVVPPPANLSSGCGLALRLRLGDVPDAIEALNRRGATYVAIHLLDPEQRATQKLG